MAGLVTVMGLMGMSAAVLTVAMSSKDERLGQIDENKALMVAQAGVAAALANISAEIEDDIGNADQPTAFSDGGYFVDVEANGDGSYTVTSTGQVRGHRATVQAMILSEGGGVYANAMFAGNSSGDPDYTLELGGNGGQKDEIYGDVYSGAHVDVTDDALVSGGIAAAGTISGAGGEEGALQAVPDLFAMNYASSADVDVYHEFVSNLTYTYDSAGGYAYQVPESNPAHIFRANPSNRSSECNSTAKVDFFLEDPYEKVKSDSSQDGSNAYKVSLSGINGEPGPSGNGLVYYIDGNLWLHNKNSFSMMFESAPGGTRATFVVEGNIYFSDNLFYEDPEIDGVAFIAMEDANVEDSGNIYFGDPTFGTLQKMYGYMYAENNFYDTNLDASGSSSVEVHGNMTAGNQIVIERDYATKWSKKHTKLVVDFDERVMDGTLVLPGLPEFEQAEKTTYYVASWRRVADE